MADLDKLRIPPHSISAEQAVLGGVMLEATAFDDIADVLREDDFYRYDHRIIFRAVADLSENNQPTDVVTVAEWLEKNELLDEAPLSYVGTLAKDAPGAANIRAYADIVRDRAVLRRLITAGNDIAGKAFAPEGKATADVLEAAQAAILDVERPTGKGPQKLVNGFSGWIEELDRRMEAGGDLVGLSTGFIDLDRQTLGLEPGDMWVLAARPSQGKTTCVMNMLEHIAGQGKAVLFFSLEMPEKQLLTRTIASLGKLDSNRLRMGQLTDEEWQRVTAAGVKVKDMPLYVDDQSGLTITEMRARARRMKRQHDIAVIAVDYLQLVEQSAENRTNEITKISRGLKALAKDLDVPVIALSQLNRSLESRHNKRPVMSDLRESGAIEQDADVIAFLYRESQYDKHCEFDYVAELDIAKQRNGPTGTILLHYNGANMRFDNLDGIDKQNYRDWQKTKAVTPMKQRGFEA